LLQGHCAKGHKMQGFSTEQHAIEGVIAFAMSIEEQL
jgi:hypothetical protein